ncbi:hypothetical protein EDB19DRAFT_2035262 [Suillus lakei]|nr:hypothetical protein EDB19DRAFT_2035262 [Suillus lakei]
MSCSPPHLPRRTCFPLRSIPGASPEALAALKYVLKDNNTKYHAFVNHLRFHNSTKKTASYQRPAIEPPEAITEENFIEHLGDDNFYVAYKTFFSKVIEEKGVSATLEEYIFCKKYNFVEGQDASAQPMMLARFLGALFHAFIHVGYGAELGIPGMVVEGLALTSVHEREIERKMEECIWISTLIYVIGGWSKDKALTADFFFMHLVTSALFLPSLLPYLSQEVASSFAPWILCIDSWVASSGATSHISSEEVKVANPFLDIVQSAMVHPNNHMLKIQRAFAHFSSLYGARSKGLLWGAARLTEEYMSDSTRPWSHEGFPVRD